MADLWQRLLERGVIVARARQNCMPKFGCYSVLPVHEPGFSETDHWHNMRTLCGYVARVTQHFPFSVPKFGGL